MGNNSVFSAPKKKLKAKAEGRKGNYYLYIQTETVYLLTIYDKSEKETPKPNELNGMIDSLDL